MFPQFAVRRETGCWATELWLHAPLQPFCQEEYILSVYGAPIDRVTVGKGNFTVTTIKFLCKMALVCLVAIIMSNFKLS